MKKSALTKLYLKLTLIWIQWYEIFDTDACDDITPRDETMMELQSDECGFDRRPTEKRNNPRYTTKTVSYICRNLMHLGCIVFKKTVQDLR